MKRPQKKHAIEYTYGAITAIYVVEDVLNRAGSIFEIERGIYKDGRHYVRYEFVEAHKKKKKKRGC